LGGPVLPTYFLRSQADTGIRKDVMRVSHYANTAERLELIAGLRALAAFLAENEDVPAPKWADVMVFPDQSPNDAARNEVDRIAVLIGTVAQEGATGHYRALRIFGSVEYRAVALPAKPEEA
jgi:hypothetical protein